MIPRLQFLDINVEDYEDDRGFDFIVTHETLEHILDLPLVLTHLARLLKPNAALLASWGAWTGVVAGHDLQSYFDWSTECALWRRWWPRLTTDRKTADTILRIPVPYSHRILTRRALKEYGQRFPDKPHAEVQDVLSMNCLSIKDYKRIIGESPLQMNRWQTNVGKHPAYMAFRLLAMIPGLSESFTNNIYAKMSRSNNSGPN